MGKHFGSWVVVAVLLGVVGCDSSAESGAGTSMEELAVAVDAQKSAQEKEQARLEAERKAEEERQAAAEAQQAQPQIETVTSHSPQRGRSLEGGGYLSVVAGTRFWAEHQVILNNVLHAMRLYEAEHGRYPKTQEEFMERVIKPNEPATALPPLPPGWEYYYDPETPLELKMINRGGGSPSAVE